jgi:hypothetical protein
MTVGQAATVIYMDADRGSVVDKRREVDGAGLDLVASRPPVDWVSAAQARWQASQRQRPTRELATTCLKSLASLLAQRPPGQAW